MDRLTLIGEDALEQGAPLAGLGGSFGAEPPVDEGLLLQTLLLPAGGLVGSGSARERQLALHKWAVSLAGLREEAVMGIRKIHRAKAVMNEQKMQEQTRLLDQLKLLLRAAKGSLDGHLAALTDLNQDTTVLLQELAQALHDLHHVSPEAWERLRERYDRLTRRRACLEADVASRDFFSFYSPDKANPLAAVAQVRELEAELDKAKGRERALEARLLEQQRANSGLRASIAAFGGAALRGGGDGVGNGPIGAECGAGAVLDGAFDAALRAYEDKCHKELAAAESGAGLCSGGSPAAPAAAPIAAPEPAVVAEQAAESDGGEGAALAAAALDQQYRSAFRRMLESVQRIHVREKEMIVKQADQEKEKQLRLVENQMAQTLERFMDGRQMGFGTYEGGGSSHPGASQQHLQKAQMSLLEDENKQLQAQMEKLREDAETSRDYALYQLRMQFEGKVRDLEDRLGRTQGTVESDFTSRAAQDRYAEKIQTIETEYAGRLTAQEAVCNSLLGDLQGLKGVSPAQRSPPVGGPLSAPSPAPSRQNDQISSGNCSDASQHTPPSDRSGLNLGGPGRLTTPKAKVMAPEDIADIALAISSSAGLQGRTVPGDEAGRLKDLPPEVLAAAAKAAADSSTKMVDTILNREGELYESVQAMMSTQELLDKIQSESAEDTGAVPRPRQSSPKPTSSE